VTRPSSQLELLNSFHARVCQRLQVLPREAAGDKELKLACKRNLRRLEQTRDDSLACRGAIERYLRVPHGGRGTVVFRRLEPERVMVEATCLSPSKKTFVVDAELARRRAPADLADAFERGLLELVAVASVAHDLGLDGPLRNPALLLRTQDASACRAERDALARWEDPQMEGVTSVDEPRFRRVDLDRLALETGDLVLDSLEMPPVVTGPAVEARDDQPEAVLEVVGARGHGAGRVEFLAPHLVDRVAE